MTKWEPPFLTSSRGAPNQKITRQFLLYEQLKFQQGVYNMEDKAPKTFLDSLLDPTSQLFPFSPFTRGLTRETGIQRNLNSFGNGDILTGTDQDDTIVIKRDLTGGSPKSSAPNELNSTQINLMDGNDSLTVGGKITVNNNQHLSIESSGGSTNITAGSIEGKSITIDHSDPSVVIDLQGAENSLIIKGNISSAATLKAGDDREDSAQFLSISMSGDEETAHNVMSVGGSLTSNRITNDIRLSGNKNEFLIGKGFTATNFSENVFELNGVNNTIKIGGNISLSNNSNVVLALDGESVDGQVSTTSFTSGAITATNGSNFGGEFSADNINLTFGKLSASSNESAIGIETSALGDHKSTTNVLVNGDIEALTYGGIGLSFNTDETTFEVTGVVSAKSTLRLGDNSAKIGIEASAGNDTLKFNKGFSLVGESSIEVTSGAGDDIVIIGGGISLQNSSREGNAYFDMELENGNDTFILTGNVANVGGDFEFEAGKGNDTVTIKGDISTQSQNDDISVQTDFFLGQDDDVFTLTGNLTATKAVNSIDASSGNDAISIKGNILANKDAYNTIDGGDGDDAITIVGNITAKSGENDINGGTGNDTISIKGNISASAGGKNIIDCGEGDDTVLLNGHINAGALKIDGGAGHDTLVLTAANNNEFVSDYKDWLNDLSSTGTLAKSNIETIRLDVNGLQASNLGWFTDIVNKANASGANIAIEDKDGHAINNVNTFLAQSNDTHNPINDVLDQYAPAAANAAQPKAFAEHVAAPSADAFTAPHFDNNNFLHEMEQQAQVHAAAVA